MATNDKIQGLLSFASNSPGVATGYGQQAEYLTNRISQSGITLAVMSNYGNEGAIQNLKLRGGKVAHYPRSFSGYSVDTLPMNHEHFKAKHSPDLKDAIFILYDSWVYNDNPALDDYPIIIWAPIDHITMPPRVAKFLQKDNVTVVSMAPDGKEQLDAAGIDNTYIPHGVETKVYKPTDTIRGKDVKDFLQIEDDTFLVGMVAANKSNGLVHRKAFAENILAFSMFQKKVPNAKLYIHSEASRSMGGFNLVNLLKSTGIPPKSVIFPDPLDLRYGLERRDLAAIYSGFDVLLAPSYGEGFGVPTVEAQACGTRVIVSSWAASKDLAGPNSWQVAGVPFWDEPQAAWFKMPLVDSIVKALELAYEAPRGVDEESIKFAAQFDEAKIWREKWDPFFRNYFGS